MGIAKLIRVGPTNQITPPVKTTVPSRNPLKNSLVDALCPVDDLKAAVPKRNAVALITTLPDPCSLVSEYKATTPKKKPRT